MPPKKGALKPAAAEEEVAVLKRPATAAAGAAADVAPEAEALETRLLGGRARAAVSRGARWLRIEDVLLEELKIGVGDKLEFCLQDAGGRSALGPVVCGLVGEPQHLTTASPSMWIVWRPRTRTCRYY